MDGSCVKLTFKMLMYFECNNKNGLVLIYLMIFLFEKYCVHQKCL